MSPSSANLQNNMAALFGPASPTFLPTMPAAPAMPLSPPIPQAETAPLPAAQQALLQMPWDPFSQAQHEAKMNAWYMGQVQASNTAKVQQYVKAWRDWSVNFQHDLELGIMPPPPPAQPVLTKVAPMRDGYWFGTNSQG